jgi:Asparagine synthase (glutamine-hydrolyzing)
VPLLDHHLVEFALSLPAHLHVRGPLLKRLLRRLAAEQLPADVVRRRKQGFAVPLAQWFRGPLRAMLHDALLGGTAVRDGYLRRGGIEALVADHDAGFDRSGALWSLLMFEMWLTHHGTKAGDA